MTSESEFLHHRKYMELALENARKCVPELGKKNPFVGAVATRDGELLGSAFRSEVKQGEHAEYTLLERKLKDVSLAGATVYSTLEPCTTRGPGKTPCAARLLERKVARVVIGMLDPNPQIRGEGILQLRQANVQVDFFDGDIMAKLEELNRDFTREHRSVGTATSGDPSFVENNKDRSLDDWYRKTNAVFWNKNFDRDRMAIFAHLVETIGTLSLLASAKKKSGISPDSYVQKSFAWWLALCGKLGVKSVEQLIWDKFPGVCSYCHKSPHDPDICFERKAAHPGPQWETLAEIGGRTTPPKTFGDWQVMFSGIYPAQQTEDYGPSFARLSEELGELAEAVRVFPSHPGYYLSEAADVFAWLMHIQNIIESKRYVKKDERGKALSREFCTAYPDCCLECGSRACVCPPILASTVGRIAHEVPPKRGSYDADGRFMTADKAAAFFADPA